MRFRYSTLRMFSLLHAAWTVLSAKRAGESDGASATTCAI